MVLACSHPSARVLLSEQFASSPAMFRATFPGLNFPVNLQQLPRLIFTQLTHLSSSGIPSYTTTCHRTTLLITICCHQPGCKCHGSRSQAISTLSPSQAHRLSTDISSYWEIDSNKSLGFLGKVLYDYSLEDLGNI